LNLVFELMVVWALKQAGLGLANTASAVFNVGFLFYALRRKLKTLDLGELRRSILPLLISAILAAAAAWFASHFWEKSIGHRNLAEKIAAVFVPMTLATMIYFSSAMLMKVSSAREIFHLIIGKFRKGVSPKY
jgi:peptidoglycan biosynthesis protein MviN/MurJ (putative lipid II flippase)